MRIVLLVTLFTFCCQLQASELSEKEAAAVAAEIKSMVTAFNKGEIGIFLQKTHPSLIKELGGKEVVEKAWRAAVKMTIAAGAKVEEYKVGKPGKLYKAGDEEVCFVPTEMTMTVKCKRIRVKAFMVAVRKVGSDDWTYLDGTGFRGDKEALWELLPKLEKGVELPEFSKEYLQ